MSRTDNARPLQLQWDDPTVAARVQHNHTTRHIYRADDGTLKQYFVLHECDYSPTNNLHNFRMEKHTPRSADLTTHCQRVAFAYGGKNSVSGHAKIERKLRRRKLRQRERAALGQIRRLNYRKVLQNNYRHEFDVLPIREDARTIQFDLD